MRTFVYDSRVIENEQQIRLEHKVKKFGNVVGMFVKFFVVFFFFVVINTLLSNLVQHNNNLFTINTWRNIDEAVRVLFVDNAFTTSSFIFQFAISIVSALTFSCLDEYGLFLRALGNADEHKQEKQDNYNKREERNQTVDCYSTVSYRQKVCFLS